MKQQFLYQYNSQFMVLMAFIQPFYISIVHFAQLFKDSNVFSNQKSKYTDISHISVILSNQKHANMLSLMFRSHNIDYSQILNLFFALTYLFLLIPQDTNIKQHTQISPSQNQIFWVFLNRINLQPYEQINGMLECIITLDVNYFIKNQIEGMKKVHPMPHNDNSIVNLSSSEQMESSQHLSCRACNVTYEMPAHEHQFVYPCTCSIPIHKGCILNEFRSTSKSQKGGVSDHHQQRYNCKKCAQVIRFTSKKYLRCRSCEQIHDFSRKHCCMCAILTISGIFVVLMFVCIIVIAKSQIFQDRVVSDSAIIGVSIGLTVTFLIVLFFCVTEVLIKTSYKVRLLEKREGMKGRSGKTNSISIIDCE